MKHRKILACMALLPLLLLGCTQEMEEKKMQDRSQVIVRTSQGDIKIELMRKEAPVSVRNFLSYVKDNFYEGLIFHRVVEGFVIQGGGFTKDMERKQTQPPIVSEADNGLSNVEGSVAMARTSDPNSATAQFYINLKDNDFLDASESEGREGYTVFGRVIEGMDVVHKIGQVAVSDQGGLKNVPVEPVVIGAVVPVEAP